MAAVIDARAAPHPQLADLRPHGRGIVPGGADQPASAFGHSMLGILVGGAIPLVLYAISAVGAGDVKLLAAIGAWVGPGPAVLIFMVQAVLGLVIVITQALAQRKHGRVVAQ